MISIIYNLTSSSLLFCFSPSLLHHSHPSLAPHTTYHLPNPSYLLHYSSSIKNKFTQRREQGELFIMPSFSESPREWGCHSPNTPTSPPRCRLQLYLRYKIFHQPPSGAGAIVAICPLSTGSGETRGNIAFSLTYCLLQGSRFC